MRFRGWFEPFLVALVLTTLNALKPIVIDDVDKIYFARQVASDPMHLYGFTIYWAQDVQPAWRLGLPPVMLYYVGAAYKLVGESPVLLKLFFLPIYWLMTWGAWSLFRRFCRGMESPLLWITAVSPAILPGLNLMHEGTVLGFGLSGLAVFAKACEERKMGRAALAGFLLDLSVQSKYTGMAYLGPFVILAVLQRRPRELAMALVVALSTFAAIETFIAFQHDMGSLFLKQLGLHDPTQATTTPMSYRLLAMAFQVGGISAGPVLLGILGLRMSRRVVAAGAAWFVLAYVVVASFPSPLGASGLVSPMTGRPWKVRPDTMVYLVLALMLSATVLGLLIALGRGVLRALLNGRFGGSARRRAFLIAWLLSESIAALIMNPFPAVRRYIGPFVVLTMIAGYVAARTARAPEKRRLIHGIACGAVALGLLYQFVDIQEGIAWGHAPIQALQWVRDRDPQGTVWFSGEWGFEYYAGAAGMKPVLRNGSSRPETGDWLVVADPGGSLLAEAAWFVLDPEELELVSSQAHGNAVPPLTTRGCYYVGTRPLEHHTGPRIVARVYRVRKPFTPVKRSRRT